MNEPWTLSYVFCEFFQLRCISNLIVLDNWKGNLLLHVICVMDSRVGEKEKLRVLRLCHCCVIFYNCIVLASTKYTRDEIMIPRNHMTWYSTPVITGKKTKQKKNGFFIWVQTGFVLFNSSNLCRFVERLPEI